MLRDVHKHAVVAGRYVCLFDGEGEIDFGFDAKVTSITKNRIEFDFSPTERVGCTDAYCGDNGILLRLVRTNPHNPVRNVRVLMPGTEHPRTRAVLRPVSRRRESLQHAALHAVDGRQREA